LYRVPIEELEELIRPAGYFRVKAKRLHNLLALVVERFDGSLEAMFQLGLETLRGELLSVNGIGPETADSILLYAGNQPVFVVDAYTRRILERHGLISPRAGYEEIRKLFERSLLPLAGISHSIDPSATGPRGSSHPPSRMSTARRSAAVQVFNEMHGLIVGVGKTFCKKSQPDCEQCPLRKFLPGAQ
jgi:endonuclease-3 related protein